MPYCLYLKKEVLSKKVRFKKKKKTGKLQETFPQNLCNSYFIDDELLPSKLCCIKWTVVLSKECECTETVLQCCWSTNVLKLPATVGSACLPCAYPVTETVQPLRRLPISYCCPEVLFLLPNQIKMCLLKKKMS